MNKNLMECLPKHTNPRLFLLSDQGGEGLHVVEKIDNGRIVPCRMSDLTKTAKLNDLQISEIFRFPTDEGFAFIYDVANEYSYLNNLSIRKIGESSSGVVFYNLNEIFKKFVLFSLNNNAFVRKMLKINSTFQEEQLTFLEKGDEFPQEETDKEQTQIEAFGSALSNIFKKVIKEILLFDAISTFSSIAICNKNGNRVAEVNLTKCGKILFEKSDSDSETIFHSKIASPITIKINDHESKCWILSIDLGEGCASFKCSKNQPNQISIFSGKYDAEHGVYNIRHDERSTGDHHDRDDIDVIKKAIESLLD